jgi:putative ABC transport system permease protein
VLQNDRGFQTDGVLTATLTLPPLKYTDDAAKRSLVLWLTQKIGQLPEVKAAGFKTPAFLFPYEMQFSVEGRPKPKLGQEPFTEVWSVTPGALEAMGTRLFQGRYLSAADNKSSQTVCIVDDLLVEQYWPGEGAIGKHITIALIAGLVHQTVRATIVGVIHHLENDVAGGPTIPGTYLSYAQYPVGSGSLVIRSNHDPATQAAAVQSVLRSLDPDLALYDARPLEQLVNSRVAPRRLSVILLSVLAGIALILATLGTYGVMAYMVTGRAQEIGLCRALGATPRHILRLVLTQGMRLALWGVLAGVVVSLVAGRLVTSMLSGVTARDPLTFAGVGGLLMAVAAVACYIPARKAMGLDPIDAVRCELAPSGSQRLKTRKQGASSGLAKSMSAGSFEALGLDRKRGARHVRETAR